MSNDHDAYEAEFHTSWLCSQLDCLRRNTTSCDCEFISGSERFPFHRFIMSAVSEFFKEYFEEHGKDCAKIQDVWIKDPRVFETLLEFVYTGILNVKAENSKSLIKYFEANRVLRIKDLDSQLANKIRSFINIDNVKDYFRFAERYKNDFIMKYCLEIMANNFDVIVKRRLHLSYDQNMLKRMLNTELYTRNPLVILECITSWAECIDEDDRMSTFEALIDFVPLETLKAEELLEVVANPFVYKSPHIREKVQNSITKYFDEKRYHMKRNPTRPYTRRSHTNQVIFFYIGKFIQEYTTTNVIIEFDPKSGQLTLLEELHSPNYHQSIIGSALGKYFMFGSKNCQDSQQYFRMTIYIPNEKKLKQLPARDTPTNINDGKAITVGDKIFMIIESLQNRLVVSYDAKTKRFENLGRVPFTVNKFALAATNSTLYIIGGTKVVNNVEDEPTQLVQSYDTCLHTWNTHLTQLPKPMIDIAAIAFGKKIYVFGNDTREVYYYDITKNTWSMGLDTKMSHKNPFPFSLNDKIIIVSSSVNQYEIYDPTCALNCHCIDFKGNEKIQIQKHQIDHAVIVSKKVSSFFLPLIYKIINIKNLMARRR